MDELANHRTNKERVVMSHDRRHFLRRTALLTGAIAAGSGIAGASPAQAADSTSTPIASADPIPDEGAYLVLLGTAAGPVPTKGRTGIASALVVDGRIYLIDMGYGSFVQFQKSGLAIENLDRIFVTHLHSDHLAELYQLLWLRFGGVDPMTHPVDLYGPGRAQGLPEPASGQPTPVVEPSRPTPGLADFVNQSIAATAYDINIRMRDSGWPDIRTMYKVHEIDVPNVGAGPHGPMAPPMKPFPVMSDERVTVTAILVDHPSVFPSFGFRFETKYGSVVFSGDTAITHNMVTLAKDADILVHEAIDLQLVAKAENLSPEQLQHQESSHADVTKIGTHIAEPAHVGTLVLSHLAPGTKDIPDDLWKSQAGKGFTGTVIVGNDLQRIAVTHSATDSPS
jgi:ribonuclease BN (tRNA processing enzyme)